MTYHILQNSTTADASDVNENFQHVASGSRLPMDTEALAPTTSLYNLGSATYKWNKLYCNTLNVYGGIQLSPSCTSFQMVSETVLTTTASSIKISGLNSNTQKEYMLVCYFNGPADTDTVYYMQLENTTPTTTISTNYTYQLCIWSNTGAFYTRTSGATYIPLGYTLNDDTTAACCTYSICRMNLAYTEKIFNITNINSMNNGFVRNIEQIGGCRSVAGSYTIGALIISGINMQAGTFVQLWIKQGTWI